MQPGVTLNVEAILPPPDEAPFAEFVGCALQVVIGVPTSNGFVNLRSLKP